MKSDAHFTVARFLEITGGHRHEFMKKLESAKPKSVGMTPQKGDLYHLRDLISVLLGGDYEAERLRKTKEEADRLAIQNARSRGELIEISTVKKLGQDVVKTVTTCILNMPMTDEEKDGCLRNLLALGDLDWDRTATA